MSEPWRATERQTTWLEGFDPDWLPDEVRQRVRTIVRRSGEVGLEIDGWVGSVSLRNGDTLHIGSKFGDADFMRILLRVQGVKDFAKDEALYSYSGSTSPLRYAVSGFMSALRDIHSQGQAFGWTLRAVVSSTKPTLIDVPRTAIGVLRQQQQPFVGWNRYRTTDLPEHRILSLAATAVLSDAVARELPDNDRRLLTAWKRRGWDQRTIVKDLRRVQAGLRMGRYAGPRGYYVPGLRLATVILGLNGLAAWGDADTSASAFLTNSDLLFEAYVRTVLFEAYRDKGLTFEKERPDSSHLFVDGTAPMEPDILVLRGANVICVGDVKHKAPDASDYYQMFTYVRQYGLSRGFMLSATDDARARPAKLLTRRDRVEVSVVPLPIGDLDELEARLSEIHAEVGF